MEPLSDKEYPRAILHFDGDSFFASVEQALNRALRGRVVVTGAERGAVTAVSVEGKKLGLGRGMSLREIRTVCPQVVIVASDYVSYGIFARRMYAIVRRYAPRVEEYSIDECFADITGLAQGAAGYQRLAQAIKSDLERALGVTFGVGLAPSKVLAKVASKHRKPGGITFIPAREAHIYLTRLAIGQLWGIGPAMAHNLNKLGLHTAYDLASKDQAWLYANGVAKPYRGIWHELRGIAVSAVASSAHEPPASIIKSRTWSPPSESKEFVYSQLALNVERACAKARRAGVVATRLSFHLKTQEFLYGRAELDLFVPTNSPHDMLMAIRPRFDALFRPGEYRATGVSLGGLVPLGAAAHDLFGVSQAAGERVPVLARIDSLNRRFGAGTVFVGSSIRARLHREPDHRRRSAKRPAALAMQDGMRRKRLDIPFLGVVR